MSRFEMPDFVPRDWIEPKEFPNEGYVLKKYPDGMSSVTPTYPEEGLAESRFPDGSMHFELDHETKAPRLYTDEEL